MVEGIFRLGELRVSELMTPRNDVIALDLNAPSEENRSLTVESPFSAYPVYRDNLDNVVGVVQSKHLLSHLLTGQALDIDQVMQKPIFIPESAAAAQALALFKETRVHMALVLDEYGGVIGLITLKDIIQEVVGDIRNKQYDPDIVQREDGSWLFDGILPIYRLSETLPDLQIPVHEEGSYTTLSGFIMVRLGRIPTVGDHFKWHEFRFEVIDMDGNHIDKVLVQKIV
jgi:putative hemolysin